MQYHGQDASFRLALMPTAVSPRFPTKEAYEEEINNLRKAISDAQTSLFEKPTQGVLVIFQAMDAAGKDGTMQAVFQGIHPLGLRFYSFKRPSETELRHDFMWRCVQEVPERGQIQVFNRSYYEEVLVVKVHQEKLIPAQGIPEDLRGPDFWDKRYRAIRQWEEYMADNGFKILKFYLHVSKKEQGKRLLDRLEDPAKHFKFQPGDLDERDRWDEYQKAYEQMIQQTATPANPWYIIPADDKRTMRVMVAEAVRDALQAMVKPHPSVPLFTPEEIKGWGDRIEAQNKK